VERLVTTVNRRSALTSCDLDTFPQFMKHPANGIVRSNLTTPGIEGYVFDGANGSQVAFWTCSETATSAATTTSYDEYMVVVQGCYTLVIHGKQTAVEGGRGILDASRCAAQW